jgi:cytosine/adenosine deaminase-related metal-dependent hydrolase
MAGNRESPWTLTARWIIPIEGPPLEWGTVTIQGERIVAVEPRSGRTPAVDLGNAAILPGFVNAHTHLDLGALPAGAERGTDFTGWLRALIRQRRSLSSGQTRRNIREGLKQSLAFGTTLLADISGQGMSWQILARSKRVRAVVFYEVLGLPKTRAHQAWAAACEWLRCHPANELCRPGLSPHAPYSVRASLLRAAANYSQTHKVPLAIHLAETREELELLDRQRGPFVSLLSELGVWDAQGLVKGREKVLQLSAPSASVLFAHGNYLDPAVGLPRHATVVYCPRTHGAFGHEPHPFQALLAAGVRVALGTDSLASNPDLDLLAEARFLHHRYPDVPADTLLRMATLCGAEALGCQDETGSLTPGKSADLVTVPLPPKEGPDPQEVVLSAPSRVQAVLFRGRWVFGPKREA